MWKAVLVAQPILNFRSVLQCPGGDERDGAFGADVRFHRCKRPCLGSGRKRGQHDQALGRSRGGFSHQRFTLKTDFGEVGDLLSISLAVRPVIAATLRRSSTIGPDLNPRAALGDKGYDFKSNRDAARQRGICPAIPYRSNTKNMPAFFPKTLYKARARIEQAVGKLKRFKRIALRCEKTAQNYGSFVALALGFILIKSVHTAKGAPEDWRRHRFAHQERIGGAQKGSRWA